MGRPRLKLGLDMLDRGKERLQVEVLLGM